MRSRINCLHPPVNVSRSLSAARSFRSQPISVIVIRHPVEASACRASTNALLVTRGAMNMHAVVITNSTAGLQWLWRSPYPSVTASGRKRSLDLVSSCQKRTTEVGRHVPSMRGLRGSRTRLAFERCPLVEHANSQARLGTAPATSWAGSRLRDSRFQITISSGIADGLRRRWGAASLLLQVHRRGCNPSRRRPTQSSRHRPCDAGPWARSGPCAPSVA